MRSLGAAVLVASCFCDFVLVAGFLFLVDATFSACDLCFFSAIIRNTSVKAYTE